MKHDWADDEANCLGEFRSTRRTIYQRIAFWFIAGFAFLSGFVIMILIEPQAAVGSTLRAIVAGATMPLCFLWVFTLTFIVINSLKLLKSCEIIGVYREGITVEWTRSGERQVYAWSEITSVTGSTQRRYMGSLLGGSLAFFSIAFVIFSPILIEFGFTGRVMEITTDDGRRYIIDRRFPERHELAKVVKSVMPPALQGAEPDFFAWLFRR